ncbi:protein NYNRIN [Trifolium repens]|nr:protein NYNRIN [Trifolium repens]
MLDRSEVLGYSQRSEEFSEFFISELCAVVCYYRMWNAKSGEDIPFEETEYVKGCDFCKWFCFYPFGEVVHSHDQEFVLSSSDGEWS